MTIFFWNKFHLLTISISKSKNVLSSHVIAFCSQRRNEGLLVKPLNMAGVSSSCIWTTINVFIVFVIYFRYFRGKYCAINMKPHLYFPKPPKYDPRTYLKNYTDEIPLLKVSFGIWFIFNCSDIFCKETNLRSANVITTTHIIQKKHDTKTFFKKFSRHFVVAYHGFIEHLDI